jgi:hypothetical protein
MKMQGMDLRVQIVFFGLTFAQYLFSTGFALAAVRADGQIVAQQVHAIHAVADSGLHLVLGYVVADTDDHFISLR